MKSTNLLKFRFIIFAAVLFLVTLYQAISPYAQAAVGGKYNKFPYAR